MIEICPYCKSENVIRDKGSLLNSCCLECCSHWKKVKKYSNTICDQALNILCNGPITKTDLMISLFGKMPVGINLIESYRKRTSSVIFRLKDKGYRIKSVRANNTVTYNLVSRP